MNVIYDRVCGLDVHRDTVVACVRVPGEGRERKAVITTFGTKAVDLLALRDWLEQWQVTHVAMESTGEYWKPVYWILEEGFKVLLVNAAHIKNVPGRKTDAKDGSWIAQLLECGLLRGSFVPPTTDSGNPGSDAIPQAVDPAADRRGSAAAWGSPEGRDQTIVGGPQHPGGVGTGDVGCFG